MDFDISVQVLLMQLRRRTDEVMQPVVREEFASKTMITVAHRLRTILVVIWWSLSSIVELCAPSSSCSELTSLDYIGEITRLTVNFTVAVA